MRENIWAGIVISVGATAIIASAKAYIDVEKIKVRQANIVDYVKETRDDVKDIKKMLINRANK